MEITSFEMWLFFTVIPNIGFFTSWVAIVSVLFMAAMCCYFIDAFADNDRDRKQKATKQIKFFTICFVIFSIVAVTFPSKKELAAILLVPSVVNNKEIQNATDKSVKILNNYLEKWAKEIEGDS